MQTAMNYIILILQRSVYVVTRSGTERGCREGLFYLGWIKFLEGRTWAPCASGLLDYSIDLNGAERRHLLNKVGAHIDFKSMGAHV